MNPANRLPHPTIFAAALAAFSLFGSAFCAAAPAAPNSAHRVAQIEHDIQPRIVLRGQPVAPVSMQERMAFYSVPGVSIAFIDNNEVAWTRQYGVANPTTRRPVMAQTLFQAGSVSKVVAALAVLGLVRDGSLTLDEDVNHKLSSWKVPASPWTQTEKVTVRRLLSHNAGVTVHGFFGYGPGAAIPTTVQVLEGAPPANSPPIVVDKPPGSGFRYSGGGYVILQQLVEDVTHEPFAQVVDSRVLGPAHMDHSLVASPLPAALRTNAADGFTTGGAPVPGGGMIYPELAPAGLWSTPTDLARLAIELDREMQGQSDNILNPPLITEMMTRQAGTWGLGVDLGKPGGEPRFTHNGANTGFSTLLLYYPERRQGVAIMTNGAEQSLFIYEILAAVARAYGWPVAAPTVLDTVSVSSSVLEGYKGTWLADGAPAFEIGVKDEHLFVRGGPFGPKPVKLYAQSPTHFSILSSGFSFDFDPTKPNAVSIAGGAISAVRLDPSGHAIR